MKYTANGLMCSLNQGSQTHLSMWPRWKITVSWRAAPQNAVVLRNAVLTAVESFSIQTAFTCTTEGLVSTGKVYLQLSVVGGASTCVSRKAL